MLLSAFSRYFVSAVACTLILTRENKRKTPNTHAMMVKLGRAAKKAKQFEVRKIVRRLKLAEANKKPALEAQLEAAKAANVQELASVAGSQLGLVRGPAGSLPDSPESCWADGPERAVCTRMLSAPCLKAVIVSLLEGDAEEAREGKPAPLDSPPASPSSSDGEEAADEVDEEAGAALAKLLQRSREAAAPSDSEDEAISLASDVSDLESLLSSSGDEAGPSAESSKAEAAALPVQSQKRAKGARVGPGKKSAPAKPKNRMGQRERRRLATMQYGRPAPPTIAKEAQGKPDRVKKAPAPALDATDLHPSWRAKRSQAAAIPARPVPATKIVFDD